MPHIGLPQGRLAYEDDGPRGAPVVLLVHGYGVDAGLWAETAEALVARGLRCVRPTLPLGAHRTPAGLAEPSPRAVADLLAALCAQLDLDDVTLVGNDTGGALCQFLVDAHPERIGRLVLTNCDCFEAFPPRPFGLLVRLARRGALAPAVRLGLRTGVGERVFGLLTSRGLPPGQVEAWTRPYLDDPAVRRETDAFLAAVRPEELLAVSRRLGRFDRPVLLVWGARDRFFTPALARRLAATFPDARLVELPHARTFVPRDEPLRLAELIEGHVRVAAPA